jgi:chaperone modulatory protein CbpM
MKTPGDSASDAAVGTQALFPLEQLCRTCAVRTEFVIARLDEGVVQPVKGQTPESWRFGETEVHHLSVAWRLQRDLGANPAGAALAL